MWQIEIMSGILFASWSYILGSLIYWSMDSEPIVSNPKAIPEKLVKLTNYQKFRTAINIKYL